MMNKRHSTHHPQPIDPLIQRLLNRDRIREARMLPDGKLTDEHHQLVREDLDTLTLRSDGKRIVSLTKIAKAIGKSPPVLSQWVSGTYAGDNDSVTRLVNNWIETTRQRERLGGADYVPTWVAEQMILRVRMAHNKRNMACVVSPSGSGKDMVVQALAEEFDGIVVYCDVTLTPKQLLVRIAKQCRIPCSRSAAEIMAEIVSYLEGRNTILFFNEAQLLKDQCGGVIRAIKDETGVTIALFGSQRIFNLIDDRANGGGQFWSRCHKVNMVEQLRYEPNPEGSGCRPLFTVAEIKAIAKKKNIRLADAAVAKMLAKIACLPTFGTLRLVCSLLDDVAYLYEDRTATVSNITQILIFGSDIEAEDILRQVGRDLTDYREAVA
ncbi:MAG: AAA family ATPase [Planctomycetota bacterium]